MPRRKLYSRTTKSMLALAIGLLLFIAQEQGWLDNVGRSAVKNQPGLYAVTRFVDGDTVVVDMNGRDETVRMIGVDTPETHKPDTPVQCYGPAAAAYTKNIIGDQRLRLDADETNQNRDRYGRLLRYVYLPDNRLISLELIKNGYGFAYTSFPFIKKDEFVAAEATARLENKGLWRNCTVTEENGRKQTNAEP